MIESILRFSIRQRIFVLIAAILLIGIGVYNAILLPIDAVPDITNKQVQINSVAPALGAEEVERKITFPLELALAGLPKGSGMVGASKLLTLRIEPRAKTDICVLTVWSILISPLSL